MEIFLREAREAWRAFALLLRGREDEAVAPFGADGAAIARSFLAVAAVLVFNGLVIPLLDPLNVSGFAVGPVSYVTENLVLWLVAVAVGWALAKLMGAGGRFAHFLVAWNWVGAVISLLFDPAGTLLLRLHEGLGSLFILLGLVLAFILMVRLVRATLKVGTWGAVGFNVAQLLATVVITLWLFEPLA